MQQTIPVNDGYISSHVGTTPSTGPFAVDFPFFSLNDVSVSRRADGSEIPELLIRGADYDITGVATDDGSFSSGSVTLYIAVSNSTVVRFRTTPIQRLSNFPLQGFFSRLALNAELNKITVWMQELNGLLGSTTEASTAHAPIVSPFFIGDPRGPTPLPGDNDTSLATTAFVQTALVGVGAAVAPGVVVDYAGLTAPPGWLLCQGQAVNRTTYAGLFTAIGTIYNVGGEAGTDFRLPDLRGRVTAGPDSGGSNRLSTQFPTSDTVGAGGGVQSEVLNTAHMPLHSHAITISDPQHRHSILSGAAHYMTINSGDAFWNNFTPSGPGALYYTTNDSYVATGISATSNAIGGSTALSKLPPMMILNKIIKT